MNVMNINEALLITQEECAEVSQAISKVFRFGMDTKWNNLSNKAHLEEELGDLLAMIEILMNCDVVSEREVNLAKAAKIWKLKKWSGVFNERSQ
jgi:NTP pyrophosphatase (non-canonical NTP hydrolase)